MAALVIYLVVLSASVAFFLWSIGAYLLSRRPARRMSTEAVIGPDTEPVLFALYCQYLLAPETALREAQEALAARLAGHRALRGAPEQTAPDDFLTILSLLQEKSPASLG